MKVTNNTPPNPQVVEQTKGSERTQPTQRPAVDAKGDLLGRTPTADIEISENARLMQKARELAHAAPDIRADKVERLKKAIQSGSYRVDAEMLAEKILDDHLGTDLGKNNL